MSGEGEKSENSFYVGDYRVDTGSNTVVRGDEKRQIEPRAMQVLNVLAKRTGETVTRAELLRLVWGDRVVVEEALTRVISQLRAAFHDSKERQLIQTVPKKGYRLTGVVVEEAKLISASGPQVPAVSDQPAVLPGLQPNPSTSAADPDATQPSRMGQAGGEATTDIAPIRHHRRFYGFALVLIAAVTAILILLSDNASAPEAGNRQVGVAVLPLEQLSADQETLYLAEGLPEELMGALARSPKLQIPSRYSALAVVAREKSEKDIADALGVRYLLEGSVRRGDTEFKIAVRLVDAEQGRVIWSQSYEDSASRLYEIPDDIAANILRTLLPERSESPVRPDRGSVENVQAYQHYLKGMYWLMNGKTSEWFYRAESAFQKAVEADPGYAAAYGSLAYVYARHDYHDTYMASSEAQERAEKAIRAALRLQPDEPNALFASAIINTSLGNYNEAESALQTVLAASAENVTARYLYSELALARNQFEEALRFAIQAKEKDMYSPWVNVNLGIVRFWRGELDAALDAVETAIRIDNDYTWAYVWKAKILQHKGEAGLAAKAMENCIAIDASSPVNNAFLGLLYLELGLEDKAWQWFDKTATYYGDSGDARFWQQFERFAYLRLDPDIGLNLLQNLSLLDNRIFSLLPVLFQLEKQSMQNSQRHNMPVFSEYFTQPDPEVNYLNQHYYFGALEQGVLSVAHEVDPPFIVTIGPPQRKDYLYHSSYQSDEVLPWQWMLPASVVSGQQRLQSQQWREQQLTVYRSE